MAGVSTKSVFDYIYKGEIAFSSKEYEFFRKESKSLLVTPLKVMALLVAISGLFAMVFEVRYFSQYSFQVYITRLLATLISFAVLVLMYTKFGKERPIFLVHILLAIIIISSGYMILLMPSTLIVNAQIVGLMIFTSALFLSWDVKNQIIVAIYYNIVFAGAILLNDHTIYFLPNMYESVIFVLFLSAISVVGSAVNFKLRMQLAERSYLIELSEKKFHSIFENSAGGMFQSNQEGKFLTVNPIMVKILGYESKEDLLKADITKDIYRYPWEREKLLEQLMDKGFVNNYVLSLKRKNGSMVIVRLNDRIVKDETGKQYYFEGSMEDITEQIIADEKRRQAEEALRSEKLKSDQLAQQATQSAVIKTQFLANMSHEIRTPMNGILGFLTLIEKGAYKDKDELKQFSTNARHSAELLLEILNDILDLSKIESGKMELEYTDFELNDIIDESVSLLYQKAHDKGLQLHTNLTEGTITSLNGDPTRLRQIFLNLLSNAVKFSEKGKIIIDISTKELNDEIVVLNASVSDEGIGIPADRIGELFQPFTQADGSHTRKFGGTGLGLVICKQFVNMMNGDINVESVKGNGSKFNFYVELKKQRNITKKIENALKNKFERASAQIVRDPVMIDNLKKERNKFKILLAEDNLINQKVALRIINDAGYYAQSAINGIEAVKAIKANSFDLILMDVQMPEMDGFTATKEIRSINSPVRNIPIIAITAHALIGDKEKCIEAGMNDYIAKPIIPDQLIKIIDRWLNVEYIKDKPAQPPAEQKQTIFDFTVLEKMSLGDKEFQNDLLNSYILDITERYIRLEKFVSDNILEKIVNEAHTIKGASYSVGAKRIGDEALGIELSGKNNDMANINQRMSNLRNAIEETEVFLKDYLV